MSQLQQLRNKASELLFKASTRLQMPEQSSLALLRKISNGHKATVEAIMNQLNAPRHLL